MVVAVELAVVVAAGVGCATTAAIAALKARTTV